MMIIIAESPPWRNFELLLSYELSGTSCAFQATMPTASLLDYVLRFRSR